GRIAVSPLRSRAEQFERLCLRLDPSRRLVTIVANLREVKDHRTFLRAARRVRAELPDSAFVLAGDGPLLEPLKLFAAELGVADSTAFIGRCDRVADLLDASDVCVLSSRSEGFSNSVLEYMAARRPVVATDVGGAQEAVAHNHCGYLVPPGDDQLMAARIVSLLQTPQQARTMGERGREIVERRFSCENQLESTERLYRELMEQVRKK